MAIVASREDVRLQKALQISDFQAWVSFWEQMT